MFCVFNVFISETVFVQVFISTVMIAQSSTSDQIMTPFRWSSNVPLFVIKFQNVIIQVLQFASSRRFFTPGTKLFCTISENQDPAGAISLLPEVKMCLWQQREHAFCRNMQHYCSQSHKMTWYGSPGLPRGSSGRSPGALFLMLELIKIIEFTL